MNREGTSPEFAPLPEGVEWLSARNARLDSRCRTSTRLTLPQTGTALCQFGTIFDIHLLELVTDHTSTEAGLTDSRMVAEAGVGLWCRREFHANSNNLRHPLCEPHQRIRDDYSGGSALGVATGEFAFFTNRSPAPQLSKSNEPA